MKKWLCIVCGWIYDEAKGWPDDGIAPGTKWEDVPSEWMCPECQVGKADFEMIEISNEDEVDTVHHHSSLLAPIVIIGSGHAGYQVAAALRAQSPQLSITVFTSDDGTLYSKPALSNAFALNKELKDLARESALSWAKRLDLQIYPHTKVTHIDRQHKKIQTNIGEYSYGQLVLATGAQPIQIPIASKENAMLSVNDLKDYALFRERIMGKKHITILGAGLIGCEFANDLVTQGYKVTVVGLGNWPMERLIPEPLGAALKATLAHAGVVWRLGCSVQSIVDADQKYEVNLTNGVSITTDLVLSAIGLKPNIELARSSGLKTAHGICTNAAHRTSDPNIFAIGDCAEIDGLWSPYISPINQAVPTLTQNLLGKIQQTRMAPSLIVVKTPILPLCIFSTSQQDGQWQVKRHAEDWVAEYYTPEHKMIGFALLGHQIQQQRNEWLDRLNATLLTAQWNPT